MGWMTGVRFPVRPGDFSLRHRVQIVCGVHPASYAVGVGDRFVGLEADYLPPPSAEFKSMWSCISTPPYVLMMRCFDGAQGLLYLTFICRRLEHSA
jgi:hypothetical protein